MTPCRSCGAPMFFVHTRKNRAMPLDAEPNPHGNVVIADDDVAEVFPDPVVAEATWPERLRYLPHHASCPQAGDWR